MEENQKRGKTTVAPEVIETIIRETGNDTQGVYRVCNSANNSGLKIKINEGIVSAEIYVILEKRENTIAVGRELQNRVARAIEEMVGMKIGSINVHIEDFHYDEEH